MYLQKIFLFVMIIMILFNVSDPSGIYFIEKLKPLKIYLVRARSRNLAGLSEPSNIVYLQTNRTFKPLGRGGRGYPYQVINIDSNFWYFPFFQKEY